MWNMTHSYVKHDSFHSRRRSDLKHLDLQISRIYRKLLEVTGTPFTHVKPCLKFWGLPRKHVWYVRGLLWKLVGCFGSRNHLKSVFRLSDEVYASFICATITESWHTYAMTWVMAHICQSFEIRSLSSNRHLKSMAYVCHDSFLVAHMNEA